MNSHWSKMCSTIAIWAATAVMFICGVFRFTWNGLPAGFLWFVVACILAAAPAIATQAIWRSHDAGKDEP